MTPIEPIIPYHPYPPVLVALVCTHIPTSTHQQSPPPPLAVGTFITLNEQHRHRTVTGFRCYGVFPPCNRRVCSELTGIVWDGLNKAYEATPQVSWECQHPAMTKSVKKIKFFYH